MTAIAGTGAGHDASGHDASGPDGSGPDAFEPDALGSDAFGLDALDLTALRRRPGVKWRAVEADVLPAWVADMDFATPEPVRRALHAFIDAGDLGYPAWERVTPLRAAFAERMLARHGWAAEADRVREVCDLIQGLQLMLHLGTAPGDVVAVQTPAYPPFLATITGMGRRVLPVPAVDTPGGWVFDVERLRTEARAAGCRTLVLVNPHNPTGRVLTRAELQAFADVADELDLLVIADEIHAELASAGHPHVPFASLGPSTAARTVTLTSATKAFSIAGVRCALVHLGDDRLLAAHDRQPPDLHGQPSVLSVVATLAAWHEGDAWLAAVVERLRLNLDQVGEALSARLPAASWHRPEAGYLAWLDLRGLGLGDDPAAVLLRRGRVQLVSGPTFGPGGEGFARLNVATSPGVLAAVLDRVVAGALG